ncbi:hypothetical protein RFF05_00600 [Bengtsoniella intestinalis]|uniref:hypothetical protein n=1 Tax=Bengtsoniella intestinalis TaxID=3073143 RepID=UPI00391FB78F
MVDKEDNSANKTAETGVKQEKIEESRTMDTINKVIIFISENHIILWYLGAFFAISYMLFRNNNVDELNYSVLHGNDLLFIVWIFLLLFPLVKEINVANIFNVVTKEYREKQETLKLKEDKKSGVTQANTYIVLNEQRQNNGNDASVDSKLQEIVEKVNKL